MLAPFCDWLRLFFENAWFATALLNLGTRLGCPPSHFYGPPKHFFGEEPLFSSYALLRALCCYRTGPNKCSGGKLSTCVLCLALLFAYIGCPVFLRFFALCSLPANVRNKKRMPALIARLRFDDLLDDSRISNLKNNRNSQPELVL